MRRYAVIGVAALLSTGLVATAWYAWPILRNGVTSIEQAAASRALAESSLIALVHLDIARSAQLQKRLYGAPDPQALLSGEDGLWESLLRAGIDPARQLDDALGAVYVDGEDTRWAAVLLGEIPVDDLRQWFSRRFDVERFDAATGTVYFTWLDERSCEPAPLHAARIGRSSVVIAGTDEIDRLWERLQTSAAAEIDIGEWLDQTRRQVATVGVFSPASMGRAAGGMTGMMLGAAGQAAKPADAVYLGMAPALMPPGIVLSGAITSRDRAFLEETHQAASVWLEEAKTSAEKDYPELVDLYERIDLSLDGPTLGAGVRLDSNLGEELARLIRATVQRAFQVSFDGSGGDPALSEEKIDEHPAEFADASPAELEPFSALGRSFFEPQWQQGPFALTVSGLRRDDEGRLQVTLQAEGRGLPNLGDRSRLVRMRISDVTDAAGKSLLPLRECGPASNREWVASGHVSEGTRFRDGEVVRFPKISMKKDLVLAENVEAADVEAIRGEIEYRMPTEVRRIRLDAPLAGEVIEDEDVRIRFQSASGRSIRYQTSGAVRRLLAVRGLNARGRVLETGGSSWGENWFAAGEHASIEMKGEVAAAEVVLAEAFEPLRYTFELRGAYPPIGKGDSHRLPPASIATPDALSRALRLAPPAVTFDYNEPMATQEVGPALLAVERMQVSGWTGLTLRMALYASQKMPFAGQLNASSIVLDRVRLAGGNAVELGLATPVSLRPDSAYWVDGKYTVDPEKPWLKGDGGVQAADYEHEEPASIEGHIVLRAAQGTREATMAASPGSRWAEDGIEIAVTHWRENALHLEIPAGAERILSIVALDAEGEPAGRADEIDGLGGESTARIELAAIPQSLEILHAARSVERRLPFTLELPR